MLRLVVGLLVGVAASIPVPTYLRVNGASANDTAISDLRSFGWSLSSGQQYSLRQRAFQVVLSAKHEQTIIWDSGLVASSDQEVKFTGQRLPGSSCYVWQVRWWDASQDSPSKFSASHSFCTAVQGQFPGEWIGGAEGFNQFRTEFTLSQTVKSAVLHATGLGYFKVSVNGVALGTSSLDPGWTNYDQTILYSTYDVTNLVDTKTAIAATIGNGFYNLYLPSLPIHYLNLPLVFRAALVITLADGSLVTVATNSTDNQWMCGFGPIVANDVFNGTTYNFSQETPGWDKPDFHPTDSQTWAYPNAPDASKLGVLTPQDFPAIAPIQEFPAQSSHKPANSNSTVFDFEQNFSGWVRLNLTGPIPSGTVITLRHAELMMHPPYGPVDGSLYYDNLRSAQATDRVITADIPAGTSVVWEPSFTYHGFRFVELIGLPYEPTLDTVTGIHVRSALKVTGTWDFKNELINQIHHNTLWSVAVNLMSLPSDCPQRDERRGWMGDSSLTAVVAVRNFDLDLFYHSWVRSIAQQQDPASGAVPDTVPFNFGARPADASWGSAYPMVVYEAWKQYGDVDIINYFWDGLNSYIWGIANQLGGNINNVPAHYGDWVPPPPVRAPSGELSASFSYIMDIHNMIEMAVAISAPQTKNLTDLASSLTALWHTTFYNSTGSNYGTAGLQSANVFALTLNATPDSLRDGVINSLTDYIADERANNRSGLGAGIIGTKFLFSTLTAINKTDTALDIITSTLFPGFGFAVTHPLEPATSLWELWDSPTQGPGMNSRAHHMFGGYAFWLYNSLVGIKQPYASAAYRRTIFHPEIFTHPALPGASGCMDTWRGQICSSWTANVDHVAEAVVITMDVVVPANSDGVIHLPRVLQLNSSHIVSAVRLQGTTRSLWDRQTGIRLHNKAPGVVSVAVGDVTGSDAVANEKYTHECRNCFAVEIGSGSHSFTLSFAR